MTLSPRPSPRAARLAALLLVAAPLLRPHPAPAEATLEGDLPRRVHIGIAFSPEDDPVEPGVLLQMVGPQGPAAKAGVAAGDVILTIDGAPVAAAGDVLALIHAGRPGQATTWTGRRGDAPQTWEITYGKLPMEDAPDIRVIYGATTTAAGDPVRTILTLPAGEGPHPVLFYVQGIPCSSIDWPGEQGPPPRRFLHDLTRGGWATFRVEKRGLGDSRGSSCSTLDFETEGADYLVALRALKADPRVDAGRVVLFGHSMGGVFAPWLAREEPVAGVIVYGTSAAAWLEYMILNTRRQLELGGADYATATAALRDALPFYTALYVDRLSPEEIRAQRPAAVAAMEASMETATTMQTRHYTFYHQLAAAPVATWWTEFDAPVLALWGAADFITSREDHEAIVELVNGVRPGRATFAEVAGADHIFATFATGAESMARGLQGPYQPAVGEVVAGWLAGLPGAAGGAAASE